MTISEYPGTIRVNFQLRSPHSHRTNGFSSYCSLRALNNSGFIIESLQHPWHAWPGSFQERIMPARILLTDSLSKGLADNGATLVIGCC